MLLLQIRLPQPILKPLEMIKEMNTPMAMIVAGISIGQADLKKILTKVRLYLVCTLRMLVFPLVNLVLLKLLFGNGMVCEILMIAGACPSATMVTMFALDSKRDYRYASEIFAFTSLIAAATIPFLIFLFQIWQIPGLFPLPD